MTKREQGLIEMGEHSLKKYLVGMIAATLAAGLLFLALPAAASAATVDEIISMHNAGLSSDIIIQVIDATGLDKPMDIDTLELLKKDGLDDSVLSYLTKYLPQDDQVKGGSGNGPDTGNDNLMGGPGFHQTPGGSGPNPDDNSVCPGGSGPNPNGDYSVCPGGPGPGCLDSTPGSVSIFRSPVYVPYGTRHRYYYEAPPVYDYSQGYWQNGFWVINPYSSPFSYYPSDTFLPYFYFSTDWRHRHSRFGFGNGIRYRGDGFSIGLHF